MIIHYYLLRHSEHYTNSLHQAIITSGFFRVSTGALHNTCTRQTVCIVLIILNTPAEKLSSAMDIVNPDTMTIHRTWHTLQILTIWNFNSLFRVCLISTHNMTANLKKHGTALPAKMLLATAAGPAYYRMCSTDVYCSKQTGSRKLHGENHHPSFLRFWMCRKENCRCSQNCGGRNTAKETQQTFVNGLLGFITLGIYTPLKRVGIAHNNCMSCPSIWATLSALLINILLYLPVVFA